MSLESRERKLFLKVFKCVKEFSSQYFCGFKLNLCGLKFSFSPVCTLGFLLYFAGSLSLSAVQKLCYITAGENPTFADFAPS